MRKVYIRSKIRNKLTSGLELGDTEIDQDLSVLALQEACKSAYYNPVNLFTHFSIPQIIEVEDLIDELFDTHPHLAETPEFQGVTDLFIHLSQHINSQSLVLSQIASVDNTPKIFLS